MKLLRNSLITIAIIGVIYISIKVYIYKTTDPTFTIGADSIRWQDQQYIHGNKDKYEIGRFICRNADGYKLYEIKGDKQRHSLAVLYPGFMGRYYKYTRE